MGSPETTGPARPRLIRRPAAAGAFYPAQAQELAGTVDELLAAARENGDAQQPAVPPRAIVVPHAGYVFSGPVAASAYALLSERRAARVVLLGPAHFVPLQGIAAAATDAWATPLEDVPVDGELRASAREAGALLDDRAHAPEHALEVQLPFLLRTLGPGFTMLPLAVGMASADDVADLVDGLWDEADLVVVSTDLSHYRADATARMIDRGTAEQVLAKDATSISEQAACGVFALRGIVEFARRRELPVRLLDLRTSADTGGDPWSVVGYGAFAIG